MPKAKSLPCEPSEGHITCYYYTHIKSADKVQQFKPSLKSMPECTALNWVSELIKFLMFCKQAHSMQWSVLIQLSSCLKLSAKTRKRWKVSKKFEDGERAMWESCQSAIICLWQSTGSSGDQNEENSLYCPVYRKSVSRPQTRTLQALWRKLVQNLGEMWSCSSSLILSLTYPELCHVVHTIQESSVTTREAHSGIMGGFYALCPWWRIKKKTAQPNTDCFLSLSSLHLFYSARTCSFWEMLSAAAQIKLSRKKNKHTKLEGEKERGDWKDEISNAHVHHESGNLWVKSYTVVLWCKWWSSSNL